MISISKCRDAQLSERLAESFVRPADDKLDIRTIEAGVRLGFFYFGSGLPAHDWGIVASESEEISGFNVSCVAHSSRLELQSSPGAEVWRCVSEWMQIAEGVLD